MAFKLSQSDTYKQKVSFVMLSETGKQEKQELDLIFKRCTNNELEELKGKPGREVMKDVVKGWAKIEDDDGAAIPFTEENLEALMQIPAASLAAIKAFWASQLVGHEKN